MRRGWLAIACLLATASAWAREPVLEATLTPPETPYHRAFAYTLAVEGDASLQCEFPEIPADAKQVEVRRLGTDTVTNNDGSIRVVQRYTLDPVFPGQYALPPLAVTWRSGDATGTLAAPPAAFHARELTPAEQEAVAAFAGIASPDAVLPPPRVSTRLWLVLAGLLVVMVVAAVFAYRHFRRNADAPVIALPPWDVALNRLRELERRNLPAAGKIDTYYVDLSAILRYYIEDRFHIQAPEQTTQEFLDAAAQRRSFSKEQQQFLDEFLRQCDRVKFARLQPGMDDMAAHFKQVRHFVKDTTPQETGTVSLEEAA